MWRSILRVLGGPLPVLGCMACCGLGRAHAADRPAETPIQSTHVVIEAKSDLHFAVEDAIVEAEKRFDAAFLATVVARTGCRVPEPTLLAHQAKLLYTPSASRTASTKTLAKAYGTMYCHEVRAAFSQEALQGWVDEVTRERRHGVWLQAATAVLTALGWLVAVLLMIAVDRWTRGYRRPLIVITTVLTVLGATVLAWTMAVLYT